MTTEKEKLLNNTYEKFMEIGLSITPRHDMLDELAIDKIMGFGSAVDEKIFSINGLKKLIDTQEKLLEGVKVDWKRNGLLRYIAADENTAVFADDITGTFKVDNESLEIYLRFSAVFEFINGKWMVVHWHGSKPENVERDRKSTRLNSSHRH